MNINGRFQVHRVTGMQRYAREVASRFSFETHLLCPAKPIKGLRGHMWEQIVLPLKSNSDLLWSPCNTGPVCQRRQVVTIHDLIPIERPEWFSPQFVQLYRWLLPRLVSRVEHVIAVSEFTRQRVIAQFGTNPDKITVIPNGVPATYRHASGEECQTVRNKLGIPDGPYVLTVSSLEPRKNLARLIAAWRQVAAKAPDATLVVAGAKGASSVFKTAELGEAAPSILFTGYVADEDLPALYSGASCFVYPSLYEGFGLPVLEALACGVPVITSNTSSIPEIVDDSAQLIDPLSEAEITQAVLDRLSAAAPDNEEIEKRIAHARRFTWDSCAASTQSLLQSFC